MTQALLVALSAVLIGADLKLSYGRWKRLGKQVELNPMVLWVLSNQGLSGGLAALLMYNLVVLALVSSYPTPLAIFFGLKLGLFSLQLKSLQYERPQNNRSK